MARSYGVFLDLALRGLVNLTTDLLTSKLVGELHTTRAKPLCHVNFGFN